MELQGSLIEPQMSLMNATDAETVDIFRTELEKSALVQEKELQGDEMMLLRFLRARKMDIPKAKLMWKEMLQWRQEAAQALAIGAKGKSESLLGHPETVLAVKSAYKRGFHGVDRGGRPIYIELLGQSDPQKLLSATNLEQYLDYRTADAEFSRTVRFPAAALHAGKHVDSQLVVLDVRGVGMKNFTATALQLLRAIQRIHGEFYPETLHKLFIINAGPAFRLIWATVRTFLHPLTVSRVRILGADYGGALTEAADPKQLPAFLGGTCVACGGDCINSDFGPWQDERILKALDRLRSAVASLPVAVAALCGNPEKMQEFRNSFNTENKINNKKTRLKKTSATEKWKNHEILQEINRSSKAANSENSPNSQQANNNTDSHHKPPQLPGSPPQYPADRPVRLLLWLSSLAFMLATWLHSSAVRRLRIPDPLPPPPPETKNNNNDNADVVDGDVSSSTSGNAGENCGGGVNDLADVDCSGFYSKAVDLNLRISAMESEHAQLKQIVKFILYNQDELLHDLKTAFPSSRPTSTVKSS